MLILLRILEAATVVGALGGMAYYVLCFLGAARFLREREESTVGDFTPPVSILKPLKGADRDIYEAFQSHCRQSYPEYELIFGVADIEDPAAHAVRRLQQEFPRHSIQLVPCSAEGGTNRKVATLEKMLPHARYPYLLINDSDIRVEEDYLREVMRPLQDPKVGMVTALYRASAGKTIPSKLEALGVSTDFMGGILSARLLEGGLHFAMGSTMAFPREALDKIGGLEPLLDYLADDYELGARISKAGYKVALANTVVETHLPDYRWTEFWSHQLRWCRNIRDKRKAGYFGVIFTFGLPWALLACALSRGAWWSWGLLALVAGVRYVVALMLQTQVLDDRAGVGDLWLLPMRDFVAMALWGWSYLGNEVEWRGERFTLRDGRLFPKK